MFRLRELNMVDPNLKKQPPVTEVIPGLCPTLFIITWAEVITSILWPVRSCQLKEKYCQLVLVLCGLGMSWKQRKRSELGKKKCSLDPCMILL